MKKILIFILILLFVLMVFLSFFKNKEKYTDSVFKTEQSCIDDFFINNLPEDSGKTYEEIYTEGKTHCQTACNNTECLYKKKINLEEQPPKKIHGEHVKINDDNIFVSWFRPETNYKYPVLRYICVIEDRTNNTTEIQIPNMSDHDLQEFFVRNLKKNTVYDLKLYSENLIGLSDALLIRNLSLSSENKRRTNNREQTNEYYNPIPDKLIKKFNETNFNEGEFLHLQ